MPIQRAKERLIQIRFTMDLVRLLAPRGASFETSEILTAIALGELQGRPFQLSKLSEFLGIPRQTLGRRLRALEKEGYVIRNGGHYLAHPERINSPEMDQLTNRVTAMILLAAEELKRLKGG